MAVIYYTVPVGPPIPVSPTDPMPVSVGNGANAVPTDAQPGEPGLPVTAQQMAYNGTFWDRAASTPDDADGVAPGQLGLAGTVSRLMAFDGTNWNRVPSIVAELPGGADLNSISTAANLRIWDGNLWEYLRGFNMGLDGNGVGFTGAAVGAVGFGFSGTTFDRLRTPVKFNTTKATTAGSSAVWTPASGTSFRIMRYKIDVTESAIAAAAGNLDLVFYDGAAAMPIAETVYVPATVSGTAWSSGWIDLANGILSATTDNVLNINLSFALTSGTVRVSVAGTEE